MPLVGRGARGPRERPENRSLMVWKRREGPANTQHPRQLSPLGTQEALDQSRGWLWWPRVDYVRDTTILGGGYVLIDTTLRKHFHTNG